MPLHRCTRRKEPPRPPARHLSSQFTPALSPASGARLVRCQPATPPRRRQIRRREGARLHPVDLRPVPSTSAPSTPAPPRRPPHRQQLYRITGIVQNHSKRTAIVQNHSKRTGPDRQSDLLLCPCAAASCVGVQIRRRQERRAPHPLSSFLGNPRLAPFEAAPDYFKQGPDIVVGGMSSTSLSQSPPSTEPESTTANDNATPHDPATDSAGPARGRLSLQLDQRSLHFSVNAWVLIVALIGIIPLATRQLQLKGYRLSLLGTTCTTGYAIFALYGLPRVGNTQAVQAWYHHVTSSKDFIPFMYCLMFVTSKLHLKLVLVPVICWALEHVARFLRRHFTNSSLYRAYLEPLCIWVEANTTAVNFLIANAEILLGFLLILSLFSKQRNAMQTFMYWQLLKLMYHSPFTAGYHRAIWLKIGRTVNPYINSYTPFLHDPINAGMRWWFR